MIREQTSTILPKNAPRTPAPLKSRTYRNLERIIITSSKLMH